MKPSNSERSTVNATPVMWLDAQMGGDDASNPLVVAMLSSPSDLLRQYTLAMTMPEATKTILGLLNAMAHAGDDWSKTVLGVISEME
jgi:hypothetical protein